MIHRRRARMLPHLPYLLYCIFFSARGADSVMMLKNTNCYLVEGYENVVHCQQAPLRRL